MFCKDFRLSLGPTQSSLEAVTGAISLSVKRRWREATHLPPSTSELKNAYICSASSPYAFTTCAGTLRDRLCHVDSMKIGRLKTCCRREYGIRILQDEG
jgi:hypothetical protein